MQIACSLTMDGLRLGAFRYARRIRAAEMDSLERRQALMVPARLLATVASTVPLTTGVTHTCGFFIQLVPATPQSVAAQLL